MTLVASAAGSALGGQGQAGGARPSSMALGGLGLFQKGPHEWPSLPLLPGIQWTETVLFGAGVCTGQALGCMSSWHHQGPQICALHFSV